MTTGQVKFLPFISEVIKIKTDRVKELIADDPHRFYNSTAWKKKRQEILERNNHECQMCKDEGKFSNQCLQVHHIEELKDNPARALDSSNLITICNRHHNLIHDKGKRFRKNKKEPITPERW